MCVMSLVWEGLQTFQKNMRIVLVEGCSGFNTVMKLKKIIPTNIPPPLKKPSKAKQHSAPHTPKNLQKNLLLRPLEHSSHLFSSNKALNAVLCSVLATAVEKTYEPVVVNAEYSNENYDNLFIAKKVYS